MEPITEPITEPVTGPAATHCTGSTGPAGQYRQAAAGSPAHTSVHQSQSITMGVLNILPRVLPLFVVESFRERDHFRRRCACCISSDVEHA